MGEHDFKDDIKETIEGLDDHELAELAKDTGLTGETARAELVDRGHRVLFTDTNGVAVANVTLVDREDEAEDRTDSASMIDAPNQTVHQQAEGIDQIDPHYAHPIQTHSGDSETVAHDPDLGDRAEVHVPGEDHVNITDEDAEDVEGTPEAL